MGDRYFDKFPIINYSNTQAVDLTLRTTMLDKVGSNPYVYYPYEIDSNERADQLSARYYEDQYKSWIFYISNKIVDPYYEWYLSENEFVDFIEKKYGSFYTAQTKIKHYRNNWVGTENISVSRYDSLTAGEKGYYEPVLGHGNKIDAYKRKQIDWLHNTNKIIAYKVSNTSFINNEICDIVFNSSSTGSGQILGVTKDTANTANSAVYIQHVSGTYDVSLTVSVTGTSYIYGNESQVNTHFSAVMVMSENISADVEAYWAPVTYLEYETEKNEYNKTINVLESNLKEVMVENLKDLMSEG